MAPEGLRDTLYTGRVVGSSTEASALAFPQFQSTNILSSAPHVRNTSFSPWKHMDEMLPLALSPWRSVLRFRIVFVSQIATLALSPRSASAT